jgi:hypothetical protein
MTVFNMRAGLSPPHSGVASRDAENPAYDSQKCDANGGLSNGMKEEPDDWKLEIKSENGTWLGDQMNGLNGSNENLGMDFRYMSERRSDVTLDESNSSANDGIAPTNDCNTAGKSSVTLQEGSFCQAASSPSVGESRDVDGQSISAHQTALSKRQNELILATPFGTFHRAPLGVWPGNYDHVTRQCAEKVPDHLQEQRETVEKTAVRRKSFSGWLQHKRPGAKLLHRSGQLGVIRKPSVSAKNRVAVSKSVNKLVIL